MKRKDVFNSASMRAEDWTDGEVRQLKIAKAAMQLFKNESGKEESKLCLHFVDEEQVLSLNQTNWDFLEDALEKDDSDDWVGAWVEIQKQDTKKPGRYKYGLRITKAAFPKEKAKFRTKPPETPPPPPPPIENQDADTSPDDSPF